MSMCTMEYEAVTGTIEYTTRIAVVNEEYQQWVRGDDVVNHVALGTQC